MSHMFEQLHLLCWSDICSGNRSLNYDDLVCNGFYDIWGDFREATQDDHAFPSLSSLKRLNVTADDSREVRQFVAP